jgi:hypothetical protein
VLLEKIRLTRQRSPWVTKTQCRPQVNKGQGARAKMPTRAHHSFYLLDGILTFSRASRRSKQQPTNPSFEHREAFVGFASLS